MITDKSIEDGEIVYGEFKTGDEFKEARAYVQDAQTDFTLLDDALNDIIWRFTNLFPGCLIKTIDSVRAKKKYFWDITKNYNRHWLACNMMVEANLGFNAFNTKKITGEDVIDFVKYRQLIAEGKEVDDDFLEACLAKPKKEE